MAYWGWGYAPYVSVGQKKAKAAKKREQLMKKNPGLKPVLLAGHALARTWWGKSWNENLERYADYSNRIGRGRSYVRHGAVLDLQIEPGAVKALVQGSQSKPYSIAIEITHLHKNTWNEIKLACEGKLESMQELLMGEFPKSLGEIFMQKEAGLFPSPKEIRFSCSCPDWADMCKHVAASLYGIGTRLDTEPSLFFKLRKVDVGDIVSQAVEDKTQKLLQKAEKKSKKVLEDSRLSEIFGIEMEEESAPKPSIKKPKAKARGKKAGSKPSRGGAEKTNARGKKAGSKPKVIGKSRKKSGSTP